MASEACEKSSQKVALHYAVYVYLILPEVSVLCSSKWVLKKLVIKRAYIFYGFADWPQIHFNILSWVKNNLHCSLSTEISADHSQTGAWGWVLQFVEKKEHKNNTHMQNCARAVKSKRCANCCYRSKCKHMHAWPVNATQMSFVSVDGQTADCLYRWGERKHPAWTQWDARTGTLPLVVMACSSSNVDLAGAGCRGWLRRWQCPSQLVVVWWLTSLGHLHFLWPLSLGGKQSSQNNGVILAFYVWARQDKFSNSKVKRGDLNRLWNKWTKYLLCVCFFFLALK